MNADWGRHAITILKLRLEHVRVHELHVFLRPLLEMVVKIVVHLRHELTRVRCLLRHVVNAKVLDIDRNHVVLDDLLHRRGYLGSRWIIAFLIVFFVISSAF